MRRGVVNRPDSLKNLSIMEGRLDQTKGGYQIRNSFRGGLIGRWEQVESCSTMVDTKSNRQGDQWVFGQRTTERITWEFALSLHPPPAPLLRYQVPPKAGLERRSSVPYLDTKESSNIVSPEWLPENLPSSNTFPSSQKTNILRQEKKSIHSEASTSEGKQHRKERHFHRNQ